MHAIILAGGEGTRLKPYTTVIPKPLMPVGGMPIVEIILRQLAQDGFQSVTITLGYLGRLIEVFFGNGEQFGIQIDYSHEDSPLGTMGPLKKVRHFPEQALVINGDILTDLSFAHFYRLHMTSGSLFSVSTFQKTVPTGLGVLDINEEGQLVRFREKPMLAFHVSMGVYMASRGVLDFIPDDNPFGFDQLMQRLLMSGKTPFIYHHGGRWFDIGRTEDYALVQEQFEKEQHFFLGDGRGKRKT